MNMKIAMRIQYIRHYQMFLH